MVAIPINSLLTNLKTVTSLKMIVNYNKKQTCTANTADWDVSDDWSVWALPKTTFSGAQNGQKSYRLLIWHADLNHI